MRYLAIAIPLAFALPASAEEKIDVTKGVEQAKAVAKAVLDGDFAKVADATHPAVVDYMGGKDKIISATREIMSKLKDMGIKITAHTVGKPADPVLDGKTAYMVIPTALEMTAPEVKVVTESYLLGITSDGGKTWVFVDGAGMSQPQVRAKVFPNLPEGLKLPEPKPPMVTKEKPKEKEKEKK